MLSDEGRTDLYIEPLRHVVSKVQTWLVYRNSFERCVGVFADLDEAIGRAIRMAEYYMSRGDRAQVHARPETGAAWCTVWHQPDDAPRFPPKTC